MIENKEVKRSRGRQRTPEYRKVRMRYSKLEDRLLPLILKLSNENEKNELLLAMEDLKKTD